MAKRQQIDIRPEILGDTWDHLDTFTYEVQLTYQPSARYPLRAVKPVT